jgi:hypothetical protein
MRFMDDWRPWQVMLFAIVAGSVLSFPINVVIYIIIHSIWK